VIEKLGKKYNFDIEEALHEADIVVKPRRQVKDATHKFTLPFTGKIFDCNCHGIKANYGLYTQCTNPIDKETYCVTCLKQSRRNTNGEPNNGNILKRAENYKDKRGKDPVKYSAIMAKFNFDRATVELEAAKIGIVIPETEYEIAKSNRGRPKKIASSSTETEPKQRGRPRKSKKVIENGNASDDLIQNLVRQAQTSQQVDDDAKQDEDEDEDAEATDVDEDEDDDETQQTAVRVFNFEGKKYLKSDDNTIYNFDTHETIGVWNLTKNAIEYEID
jgi:hypothetical protein